jgi:hypothetical protein
MRKFLAGLSFFCGAALTIANPWGRSESRVDVIAISFAIVVLLIVVPYALIRGRR